ncbi:MAG: hypothetical protein AAGD15_06860 [Agrobacterium cavarae]
MLTDFSRPDPSLSSLNPLSSGHDVQDQKDAQQEPQWVVNSP